MLDELVAEKILKEKRRLLQSVNLSDSKIDEMMRETESAYQKYKKIHELQTQGLNMYEIGLKVDVRPNKVHEWLNLGKIPRHFFALDYFGTPQMNIDHDPESNSGIDFAHVLGLFSARSGVSKMHRFEIVSVDKKYLSDSRKYFVSVFNTVPIIKYDHSEMWRYDFVSREFADLFKEHTKNNTCIPWALLNSDKKKSAFFSSFFGRVGYVELVQTKNVNSAAITFSFKKRPTYINEFALLCFDLELIPTMGKNNLLISDYADLKKIVENHWCDSAKRAAHLETVLSETTIRKNPVEPEFFMNVMRRYYEKKIVRAQAIDELRDYIENEKSIDRWLYDKSYPKRIKRFNVLKKEDETNPARHVLAYAFNHFNVKLDSARIIADNFDLEFLKKFDSLDALLHELKLKNKDSLCDVLVLGFSVGAQLERLENIMIKCRNLIREIDDYNNVSPHAGEVFRKIAESKGFDSFDEYWTHTKYKKEFDKCINSLFDNGQNKKASLPKYSIAKIVNDRNSISLISKEKIDISDEINIQKYFRSYISNHLVNLGISCNYDLFYSRASSCLVIRPKDARSRAFFESYICILERFVDQEELTEIKPVRINI